MRRLAFAGALLAVCSFAAAQVRPFKLMVGDPAPPLTISKWLQGEPVSSLDKKGITVVEFWAHWCPYCRRVIPHLCALAKKFRQEVNVVSVEVEDPHPEEVPDFIAAQEELSYTVGMDDCPGENPMTDRHEARKWSMQHGKTSKAWLVDSGLDKIGIPELAIVVDGRVAWFGDPDVAEGPLESIVAGKFDYQAEIASYAAEKAVFKKGIPLLDDLKARISNKDWSGALPLCDQLLVLDPVIFANQMTDKVDLLLRLNQGPAAYAYVRDAMKSIRGTPYEADFLNAFAWSIVEQSKNVSVKDFDLAIAAAKRGTEVAKFKPGFIFDTLAAAYLAAGDRVMAIESEKRAYLECERYEKADFRKTLNALAASR